MYDYNEIRPRSSFRQAQLSYDRQGEKNRLLACSVMKKKPTQKPTAKWVFFCFQGISVLTIDRSHQVVTNMMDRQRIILDALGHSYWEFYS